MGNKWYTRMNTIFGSFVKKKERGFRASFEKSCN